MSLKPFLYVQIEIIIFNHNCILRDFFYESKVLTVYLK